MWVILPEHEPNGNQKKEWCLNAKRPSFCEQSNNPRNHEWSDRISLALDTFSQRRKILIPNVESLEDQGMTIKGASDSSNRPVGTTQGGIGKYGQGIIGAKD